MEFKMYKIHQEDVKIKVPCKYCLEKGIIDSNCNKCGGAGVHKQTINVWKIEPGTETIYKIDRAYKDIYHNGSTQIKGEGELRYWTNDSEFYNEKDRYLHFNKADAQKECDKRNADIKDILKIYNKNMFSS